jgi:hypothetical protein
MPRYRVSSLPVVLRGPIAIGLIASAAVLAWWAYLETHQIDRHTGRPPAPEVKAVVAYERAHARPLFAQDISVEWDSSPTSDARLSLCTSDVLTLPNGDRSPCAILQYTSTEVSRFKGPVDVHAEVAVSRLADGRWHVIDRVEP